MSSTVRITPGEIVWQQDLDGSTSSTAYPSASTDGIALPTTATRGMSGQTVHVKLRYQVASGTLSMALHLYGYDADTAAWGYLASCNGGNSIVYDAKWSPDTVTIILQERFAIGHGQMTRFKTRAYGTGGTTPLVSTWVGYERG